MIIVVGSANMDLVVPVKRLPVAGETIFGGDLMTLYGGKGANQAIAAARLGAEVQFVGCVGNDDFGRKYAEHLARNGVATDYLRFSRERPTGTAMIFVEERGENVIVVSPGANHDLSLAMVDTTCELFSQAALVLLQFEIPYPTVRHVITLANKCGVPVILNPSPAQQGYGLPGLEIDYLILNQIEAETLSGITSMGVENISRLTNSLREFGSKNIIMTRGANNTIVNAAGHITSVPTVFVEPVDTVGAGDTFAGAFAVAINEGQSIEEAARFANTAAALATLRHGAQTSMPARAEVESLRLSAPIARE